MGFVQESLLINFKLVIGLLVIGPSLSPACHFTKIVGHGSVFFIIQTTKTIGRFVSIKFNSKGGISGGKVK